MKHKREILDEEFEKFMDAVENRIGSWDWPQSRNQFKYFCETIKTLNGWTNHKTNLDVRHKLTHPK